MTKIFKFYQNIAKTGVTKILINIPLNPGIMQKPITKPLRRYLASGAGKYLKKIKKTKKNVKMQLFLKIA